MEAVVSNIRRRSERVWLMDAEFDFGNGPVRIENVRLAVTSRGRYAMNLPSQVTLPEPVWLAVRAAAVKAVKP